MSNVNLYVNRILEGASLCDVLLESTNNLKEAFAVYTGGGIWLFYGQLTNGNYFLMDDNGWTLILNADPSDFDESTYEDWQQEHLIKELDGKERTDFCDAVLDYIASSDQAHRGGITDREIDFYRGYFKESKLTEGEEVMDDLFKYEEEFVQWWNLLCENWFESYDVTDDDEHLEDYFIPTDYESNVDISDDELILTATCWNDDTSEAITGDAVENELLASGIHPGSDVKVVDQGDGQIKLSFLKMSPDAFLTKAF